MPTITSPPLNDNRLSLAKLLTPAQVPVVHDLTMNRGPLTLIRETKEHEVVCAHSAHQAMVLARQQPPDRVPMDISMRDKNGVWAGANVTRLRVHPADRHQRAARNPRQDVRI